MFLLLAFVLICRRRGLICICIARIMYICVVYVNKCVCEREFALCPEWSWGTATVKVACTYIYITL